MYFKGVITELLWFLRGDTNIKFLHDNDCHIWDGDAYKNYKTKTEIMMGHGFHGKLFSQEEFINKIKTDDEFAKTWGELGPVYGKKWRDWNTKFQEMEGIKGIDQIKNLIIDLKKNPDSRRLMISAWDPSDLPNQILPPCHYGFQVYTRELSLPKRMELWEKLPNKDVMDFPIGKLSDEQYHVVLTQIGVSERSISLMWNQRSCDFLLGIPFNIASYATLLEILAKEVNMVPDELIGNLGDCHIYSNHIEQVKEQISRTPYKLPTLKFEVTNLLENLMDWKPSDFSILNYESHPAIKAPLSN
jgi:thymidylate synthase